MGAAGRYGQGDTQWMTAGSGVQHSEMFPLLNKTEENPLELFQIWLNLPKAKKMSKPYFTMLWADKIPSYHSKDSKGKITDISIIAGTIHGTKAVSPPPDSWAADPNNEVAVWTITMEPGAEFILPPASEFCNRTLYFHKGNSLTIGKTGIEMNHAIDLIPDAETVLINGNKESRLLLLQGRPINEPAVQYGPFVMNTEAEIRETIQDYRKTEFGGWPWDRADYTHPPMKGRFAVHGDGREENLG